MAREETKLLCGCGKIVKAKHRRYVSKSGLKEWYVACACGLTIGYYGSKDATIAAFKKATRYGLNDELVKALKKIAVCSGSTTEYENIAIEALKKEGK